MIETRKKKEERRKGHHKKFTFMRRGPEGQAPGALPSAIGRIQRAAPPIVSQFQARSIRPVSPLLGECQMANRILNAPCRVRLRQARYYDMSQTRTQTLTSSGRRPRQGTMTYSVLDTVMKHLIDEQGSENVCLGGHVEITIQGSPDGPNASDHRVVRSSDVTRVQVRPEFGKRCARSQLIYFPVFLRWCDGKGVKAVNCPDAHSMAVLVDRQNRVIEYYEPNGSGVPWFQPVSDALASLFGTFARRNELEFRPVGSCPRVGIQGVSGEAKCAYFSSLYMALRLGCTQIPPSALVTSLRDAGPDYLRNLIQHWHCFLIDYAERMGIAAAAEDLPRLYAAVFTKLINPLFYDALATEAEQDEYWSRFRVAERSARYDIVDAYVQMDRINNELQAK